MKHIGVFLILIARILQAQPTQIVVKGRVNDNKEPEKRMQALFVKLNFSTTSFIEKECDSLGHYSFELNMDTLAPREITLTVRQDIQMLEALRPKAINCCGAGPINDQYFTNDKKIIHPVSKPQTFIADFKLIRVLRCGGETPEISFEKNDTALKRSKHQLPSPDSVLCCVSLIMKDNPTVVIEVAGRSWKEKHGIALSAHRAEKIKQILVNSGIDEGRILAKGYGESLHIYSTKEIRKTKNRKEKEDYVNVNRISYIRFISFDYDPKLKKRLTQPKETPTQPNQDSDD